MTLTEFLTARLDEDEAVARAIDDGRDMSRLGEIYYEGYYGYGEILTMGSGRALAEVEAKRRIAHIHRVRHFGRDHAVCETCHTYTTDYGDEAEDFPCDTLRLLALPYADHPDYDEAWRP